MLAGRDCSLLSVRLSNWREGGKAPSRMAVMPLLEKLISSSLRHDASSVGNAVKSAGVERGRPELGQREANPGGQ
jgi:hypothetical protein